PRAAADAQPPDPGRVLRRGRQSLHPSFCANRYAPLVRPGKLSAILVRGHVFLNRKQPARLPQLPVQTGKHVHRVNSHHIQASSDHLAWSPKLDYVYLLTASLDGLPVLSLMEVLIFKNRSDPEHVITKDRQQLILDTVRELTEDNSPSLQV